MRLILSLLLLFSCSKDLPREWAKHVVPFKLLVNNNDTYATGFHIKYRNKVYILTNKHVCDLNHQVYKSDFIQFGNYVGKILKIDDIHDLCLVTSNRNDGLSLADTYPAPLDKVTLIGFPRGLEKTIREGRAVSYENIYAPWVRTDYPLYSYMISTITYGGNSGSPVLNEDGDVVGVLFAGDKYLHTEGFVVPLQYIKYFLSKYTK